MLGIMVFGMLIVHTTSNFTAEINQSYNTTFKDYLDKFKPSQVWMEIEERNRLNGLNCSFKDELETILKRIDPIDELLAVKVKNGNPRVVIDKDKEARRQFNPPGKLLNTKFDQFRVRNRLVELMKQAIYQARNKMVIMQELRAKYNKISVYKMGFLMSKTDNACRIFATFAYKSFKFCTLQRQYSVKNYQMLQNLEAIERLLDLWFDVDLLIDLIFLNHENCLRMLRMVISNRKHAWKFVD
ncbi:uncharacterized protein LOC116772531 [Danaus plexippus]|uniref:uncharacterized protein LOC116772531 n=1 Tax=Danaus plexippus TaxID=13037 RepID=UPI002AB22CEA|nr:uncharacterized protein LOC116772531 [Danaus plexippus]